jgi:hypothetical protein
MKSSGGRPSQRSMIKTCWQEVLPRLPTPLIVAALIG